MYSVWDLDDAESSSDEDDEAFMTPSEGLSEVEEGDEDDDEAGAFGRPRPVVAAAPVSATTRTTTKKRGDGPPGGEPSIRRHTITAPPTKVKKRDITPANALSIDQAAVLGKDLDSCREILSLFLRSQMRAAEERCEALDPHGNRLYLQSAHGIIQSLKVSPEVADTIAYMADAALAGDDDIRRTRLDERSGHLQGHDSDSFGLAQADRRPARSHGRAGPPRCWTRARSDDDAA